MSPVTETGAMGICGPEVTAALLEKLSVDVVEVVEAIFPELGPTNALFALSPASTEVELLPPKRG